MFCIFLDLAEKKYFFKLFYSVLALKMIRFSYLEIIFIYPPHFLITELFSDYANDCLKLMGSMGAYLLILRHLDDLLVIFSSDSIWDHLPLA